MTAISLLLPRSHHDPMVEGGGFEPPKALPTDLQSVPFSHSGTPPHKNYKAARRRPVSHYIKPSPASPRWSWRWDSNPQPADYKSAALPIELRQLDKTGNTNRFIPKDQLIFWLAQTFKEAKHNQALSLAAKRLIVKIRIAYSSIFWANPLSRYFSKAMAKVRYTM